jgi:uncharacterized membrane protein
MNSDLIVMTFEGVDMAQVVHNSLGAMRKSHILGLDDAAVVTRNGDGLFKLRGEPQVSAGLVDLLADRLFCSPDGTLAAGTQVKLDVEFVAAVESALHNSGSALLFHVHPDSPSDPCELLDALALFRGTIHQTTLSPQGQAFLREML